MSTVARADFVSAEDLRPHVEAAWERQRAHVTANSPFYCALWQGAPPPLALSDLSRLPLSDKAQLRLSQAATEVEPATPFFAVARHNDT